MTGGMPLSAKQIIAELGKSESPLSSARLSELTNLDREEMELFKSTWPAVGLSRRRAIMERLVELAEDNVELCYDDIFKYALKDADAEIQVKAIEGLWENEESSLISPLISLLEQSQSEKVRAAAALALGKFVMLAEQDRLRSPHLLRLRDALLGVIGDAKQRVEIRRRALEAIAPMSLPEVRAVIMRSYQGDNLQMKIGAIYAMGRNCDPSWLPLLIEELSNDSPEVRYEAIVACGELEEEAAVPHLVGLVRDPDSDVRMAAIKALGDIGGRAAKEFLEECLDHPDDVVRQMAEEALEALHHRQALLSFNPPDKM